MASKDLVCRNIITAGQYRTRRDNDENPRVQQIPSSHTNVYKWDDSHCSISLVHHVSSRQDRSALLPHIGE